MRIGILGTGAIARKHAQAWRNIGCTIAACANQTASKGLEFAREFEAEFVTTPEDLCRHSRVDLIDVCTFPDYRLAAVEMCAALRKPVQVQKPIAVSLSEARRVIDVAANAGIVLSVVSQQRFNDAALFLKQALAEQRLGRIIQADAYVKWYRPPSYYSRSIKGSWKTEGGGALINQAIHQVDLLRWFIGPVEEVFGRWKLGVVHRIESEDLISLSIEYASGALGALQAATSIWPGYPERIEIHGENGTAIIEGDRLTAWDVQNDSGSPPPLARNGASGASDPMAISLVPFERQFADVVAAISNRRAPSITGQDGFHALAIVEAAYESCRTGQPVRVASL